MKFKARANRGEAAEGEAGAKTDALAFLHAHLSPWKFTGDDPVAVALTALLVKAADTAKREAFRAGFLAVFSTAQNGQPAGWTFDAEHGPTAADLEPVAWADYSSRSQTNTRASKVTHAPRR